MKLLILVLALLTSTLAFSGEVKVLDVAVWNKALDVRPVFGFNTKLGRAWVEVTTTDRFDNDDEDFYRTKVEGLSFDASLEKAFLDVDGQVVECAAIKRDIFRQKFLVPTGCKFESRFVTVAEDNGFEIVKRRRLQVFLVTK